jgi:hypothetical protein
VIGDLIVEDRSRIVEDRTILGVSLDQILPHAQQAHHQHHVEGQQQQDGNKESHDRLRDCRCMENTAASRDLDCATRTPASSVGETLKDLSDYLVCRIDAGQYAALCIAETDARHSRFFAPTPKNDAVAVLEKGAGFVAAHLYRAAAAGTEFQQ